MTTRRGFLKTLGAGILVGIRAEAQRRGGGRAFPPDLSAWLHIAEDGTVTAFTGKIDGGQNSRTALTQVIAEELRAPLGSIRMVMGDTDLVPYDAGTFGSQTTPVMSPQMRRAAATARELLVDLAARRWKADRASLTAANGKVSGPGGQSVSFGELTRGQKLVRTISPDTPLTPATEWKTAGTSAPKVNGRDMVTGRHKFPSDLKPTGVLFGKVLRPPAAGASLAAFDASAAEAMQGVKVVREGDFAAVAAPTPAAASRALAALKADWKTTPQPGQRELFEHLKKTAKPGSGDSRGSLVEGMAAAEIKLSAAYTTPYIAHVPLEPRAAVAEWKDGKLTVWTGTQRPFGVRAELASAFGIPEDRVRVIMPDMGSGYGGKHTGDAAIEAARLARAAGKPVKVVWTREEEFNHAYFRPAALIEVSSGARKDGTLTAWEFHNYNSGGAGIATYYDVPHRLIEFHPCNSPLRQGSYRALAATANHFARETHMDELARACGMDPLQFRLKNVKDERFRAVLQAAAARFAWPHMKASPQRGFGVAAGFEKGGYVATCVEVEADKASGTFKVLTVVEAFECGAVINPDHIRNQIEGCIVMGLGGALFEKIEFEEGKILNPRLSRYRVPRFADVPAIEIVLLDRKDLTPAGAGETPIVGIAPAIGNAIFDATGVRLRSLPLDLRALNVG